MLIKYNIDIEPKTVEVNLQRIVNLIYKLLPIREEGADWRSPLLNIMEELSGMDDVLKDYQVIKMNTAALLGVDPVTGESKIQTLIDEGYIICNDKIKLVVLY